MKAGLLYDDPKSEGLTPESKSEGLTPESELTPEFMLVPDTQHMLSSAYRLHSLPLVIANAMSEGSR